MGRTCGTYGRKERWVLVGKPEGKRPIGRAGINERTTMKRILKKQAGRSCTQQA